LKKLLQDQNNEIREIRQKNEQLLVLKDAEIRRLQSLIQTKFQDQFKSIQNAPMQADIAVLQSQLQQFAKYSEELIQELQSKEDDIQKMNLEISQNQIYLDQFQNELSQNQIFLKQMHDDAESRENVISQ